MYDMVRLKSVRYAIRVRELTLADVFTETNSPTSVLDFVVFSVKVQCSYDKILKQ